MTAVLTTTLVPKTSPTTSPENGGRSRRSSIEGQHELPGLPRNRQFGRTAKEVTDLRDKEFG
jgi:hypothetical protein